MALSVTELRGKLRVDWIDFYSDDTMNAFISDEGGRQTVVCIDGRKGSSTRYRLFEKGRHPNKGAVLVELGAEVEGIVIPLLSRFLSRGPKAAGQSEYGWDLALETLMRFGEPILASAGPPTAPNADLR